MSRVVKPFLPPLEEYVEILKEVWENKWLTNDGPFLQQFELDVPAWLKSNKMVAVANGTLGIQLALKALNISGEIITTPFSFVATSSSALWEKYKLKFVDIDAETWNIDPKQIERNISPETEAVLATHVFGNPCDVDSIREIAEKYKLKVIYDAAHAFGVTKKEESIFNFGDVSICSFHATKVFHTVEGGGVFSKNSEIQERIIRYRNFGYKGKYNYVDVGINAKMSELHAAMGLINLRYLSSQISSRLIAIDVYKEILETTDCVFQRFDGEQYNGAYCPVLFPSAEERLSFEIKLKSWGFEGRRYFYPTLDKVFNYPESLPISNDIADRIFCLPLLPIKELKPLFSMMKSYFS